MNKRESEIEYINRMEMFLKVICAERGIDLKFIDCTPKDIKNKSTVSKMKIVKESKQC